MIDTDKYEGHTEGEWRWYEGARHKTLIGVMLFGEDGNNVHPKPADAQLIADAPLLLAGFKRWKKEHDTVRGWFLDIDNYMMEHHHDMWQEIRKEIGLDD